MASPSHALAQQDLTDGDRIMAAMDTDMARIRRAMDAHEARLTNREGAPSPVADAGQPSSPSDPRGMPSALSCESGSKLSAKDRTPAPLSELPSGRFGVIVADPPWAFAVRSPKGAGRSASQHYATMSLADIKALPVADCAARDSALLLWAIDPMIPQALEVMAAWGFTFKTVGFYWAKSNRTKPGFRIGTGYYTRANPEQCLLGTRGSPKRLDRGVPRLIVEPAREHSRKPGEAFMRTERLFGGPYLELFARAERPGWTVWGNETGRFPNTELPAPAAGVAGAIPLPVGGPPADRLTPTAAGCAEESSAPGGFFSIRGVTA
jgi:N6-adenosine-specific RNA methylase IME4